MIVHDSIADAGNERLRPISQKLEYSRLLRNPKVTYYLFPSWTFRMLNFLLADHTFVSSLLLLSHEVLIVLNDITREFIHIEKPLHHDLPESRQERLHLRTGADRDAQEIRQGRKQPSDFDSAIAQSADDGSNLAPKIDHHEIRM